MTAPRDISRPRPGLYRVKLVKNGPWVPARIIHAAARDPLTGERLDRSWYWSTEINGELVADPSPDPGRARVDDVWLSGRPITLNEFRFLEQQLEFDRQFAPAAADPRRAIDVRAIPPIF
jgi:hypothetical protein